MNKMYESAYSSPGMDALRAGIHFIRARQLYIMDESAYSSPGMEALGEISVLLVQKWTHWDGLSQGWPHQERIRRD